MAHQKFLATILLFVTVQVGSCYYVDHVIPAPLQDKYESLPGNRAERLEKNMRLMAVMNFMQQGWHLYGGNWYKLFEEELMWIPAENFCRELGGHLVNIKDAAENDFVHSLRRKSNVWIGLNKINATNGIYGWSDGTRAEYLNWDSTQPNEPSVDCVYMRYDQEKKGTWFDYACREQLPQYFVCKLHL